MKRNVGAGPLKINQFWQSLRMAGVCVTLSPLMLLAACGANGIRPVLSPPPPHPYYLAQRNNPSRQQLLPGERPGAVTPAPRDQVQFYMDLSGKRYSVEIKPAP